MPLIFKQILLLLNTYSFIIITIIANLDRNLDIIKNKDFSLMPILAWPLWIISTLAFALWIDMKLVVPFMAFTFVGSAIIYMFMEAIFQEWRERQGIREESGTYLKSQRWRMIVSGLIGTPFALAYPVHYLFQSQ